METWELCPGLGMGGEGAAFGVRADHPSEQGWAWPHWVISLWVLGKRSQRGFLIWTKTPKAGSLAQVLLLGSCPAAGGDRDGEG